MTPFRPEHEILICVSRRNLGFDQVTRLRELGTRDLDWEYLLNTARRHRVLPLLHKHANTVLGNAIPQYFRSELKRESVMNTQSMLYLTDKTLKLKDLLCKNDIPCALFKGALLAEMAYGDIGLRQAGDIDLLIPRKDFVRAKELLKSTGYQMHPELTPAQQTSHLAHHCEIQFVKDEWFTVVDLHWALTPRSFVFSLSGDEVMARLQRVSFAGAEVQTFSAADHLLYQSMHGAKHLWRRLEWIASLAELARSLEPSAWSEVVNIAEQARAKRILALGLRLVENVFTLNFPKEILATLDEDGYMQTLAVQICDGIFSERDRPRQSTDTSVFNLKIMDRKRDALVSALRAFFVPTLSDWEALSLPQSLHGLYYALRPIRLSKVYSATLVRKLTHKPAR